MNVRSGTCSCVRQDIPPITPMAPKSPDLPWTGALPVQYGETSNPLREILLQGTVHAVYQPVLSVSQKRIMGYEGLARGVDPTNGNAVSPLTLFRWAAELDAVHGMEDNGNEGAFPPDPVLAAWHTHSHVIALDRLCREVCLQGFRELLKKDPHAHLLINLDAAVIDLAVGSDYLLRQVEAAGIPHENVIIEISEGGVRDLSCLMAFVDRYREAGFLLALDDLGTGFSNLDRIGLLQPDLIKLDRALIQGVEASFHKQEVFRCLVGLANKVGALVVAEGVETLEELYAAIRFGAHFIQGFFFARPVPAAESITAPLYGRMEAAASGYVRHALQRMEEERTVRGRRDSMMDGWMARLVKTEKAQRDSLLAALVQSCTLDDFECVYLLDARGIQTTDTMFGLKATQSRRNRGHVFTPTHAGADNSMKRYFHELVNVGAGRYVSEPYVSHATGRVCVTHSRLAGEGGDVFVLCVDFRAEFEGR